MLLGSIGRIPELLDKKFEQGTVDFSFFTALDPTEYWGVIWEWVYLSLQTVKYRLPKSETRQSDTE